MDLNLKKLTLVYVVLSVATLTASLLLEPQLPAELQHYINTSDAAGGLALIGYCLLLIVGIFHLIAVVGLLFTTESWAKSCFLYTTLLAVLASVFFKAYVDHGVSMALSDLGLLVAGMMSALILLDSSAAKTAPEPISQEALQV